MFRIRIIYILIDFSYYGSHNFKEIKKNYKIIKLLLKNKYFNIINNNNKIIINNNNLINTEVFIK